MISVSTVHGYLSGRRQKENKALRITDDDLDHMNAFPAGKKLELVEKIMSCTPAASAAFKGNNHYERAILRLRRDDFRLIDLQPQEFLFTSVWYRKYRSTMRMPHLELAMLLWISEEQLTNLTTWRI
jgi:hypothetical protein